MRRIAYEKEQIDRLVACLNSFTITGIEQAKILVLAGNILETGKESEIVNKKEE